MKRKYSLFFLSVVFFTVLFSSNICLADSLRRFHSEANGYSIEIPDGWIEIPNEIVEESFELAISAKAKPKYYYEIAFQQNASGEWFQYPYVLVQVMRYSNFGLSRQIHKSEFKEIISGLTGLDVDELINKTISPDIEKMSSGGTLNEVYLDKENNLFKFGIEMDIENVGKMKGQSIGHFGQYSIVQVNFYDLKPNWSKTSSDRELIQGSFKFDPATAYSETAQKPFGLIERIALRYSSRIFTVLIIVGVAIWWWRYDWRKRSLKQYDKVHKNEAND